MSQVVEGTSNDKKKRKKEVLKVMKTNKKFSTLNRVEKDKLLLTLLQLAGFDIDS